MYKLENLPLKLRAKQVIKLFPVGLSTIWYYAKLGKLRTYKVSKNVTVFDTEELIILFGGKNDESSVSL